MKDKRPVQKMPKSDIPALEIITEKTSEELILDAFQKHKNLSPYQLTMALDRSASSIFHTMKRMEERGILTSRKVFARVKGARREIIVFSLASKK